MSSEDWKEIKRLAADFQRAQLISSIQKLSERNCVEIISKLLEKKLLEVIYTADGKEFITPSQLIKEIKDELYMHSGRIHLTELCNLLNIDLSALESRAISFATREKNVHYILGQLISDDYLDKISEEINENLQINGSITIADIAKMYDLPGDFLRQMIDVRLGKIIKGQQESSDPDTIFTLTFISRHKYQIRGILTAISRPTTLNTIISTFQFQENLFYNITAKLISSSILEGYISGSVYVPNIYTKAQFEWVKNFLEQNGYLEYDALQRLQIHDPASYIKRHFSDSNLTFVLGACIGQVLLNQLEANIDEALINGELIDLASYFPSSFTDDVCKNLIIQVLNARENNAKLSRCTNLEAKVFGTTIVCSDVLLTKLTIKLEELMPAKAKEALAKGAFKQKLSSDKSKLEADDVVVKHKKDDRRKKAVGGKAGGGTQGRETKTKSTKNKHRAQKHTANHDSDEDIESQKSNLVEFLSLEEMTREISDFPVFRDNEEELAEEVAQYLHPLITRKFQDVARELFASSMHETGDNRKKTHQTLQEKVSLLLTTARLADKGLKEFGDDLQVQLSKYLLKTHCTDIVNEIITYMANDLQLDVKNKALNNETRLKIIDQMDSEVKGNLVSVNKSLISTNLELFLSSIEDAIACADILLKKKDNKKDRQFLLSHRSNLVDQLNASLNSAVTMHLACLILFQSVTGNLLHASGKFVPQVLAFLKPHLPSESYDVLFEYQNLVMKSLTMDDENDAHSSINARVEELTPKLKEIAITFRKSRRGGGDNSLSED